MFIAPSNPQELKERILQRENTAEEEIKKRLETAKEEYELLSEYLEKPGHIDYLVLNNNFEECFNSLCSIVKAERCRIPRQDKEALKDIFNPKKIKDILN
ncbi:MAG: hypothetical protein D6780_07155 [Candidatus Dadabacteria bacterium]|nr:MAG: hypothetical protein D6780_07155 [Candidatus Dadabacteria bacterium]